LLPPPQAVHVNTNSKAVVSPHSNRGRTFATHLPSNMKPNRNMNPQRITRCPKAGGLMGHPLPGQPALRAVVVTLTVTALGLVPSGVTAEGVREQVAAEGAPLQERETD